MDRRKIKETLETMTNNLLVVYEEAIKDLPDIVREKMHIAMTIGVLYKAMADLEENRLSENNAKELIGRLYEYYETEQAGR